MNYGQTYQHPQTGRPVSVVAFFHIMGDCHYAFAQNRLRPGCKTGSRNGKHLDEIDIPIVFPEPQYIDGRHSHGIVHVHLDKIEI